MISDVTLVAIEDEFRSCSKQHGIFYNAGKKSSYLRYRVCSEVLFNISPCSEFTVTEHGRNIKKRLAMRPCVAYDTTWHALDSPIVP